VLDESLEVDDEVCATAPVHAAHDDCATIFSIGLPTTNNIAVPVTFTCVQCRQDFMDELSLKEHCQFVHGLTLGLFVPNYPNPYYVIMIK